MFETGVGFVDVVFLRASGSSALGTRTMATNPDAREVVNWLRRTAQGMLESQVFLRAYWYDGAFDPSHHDYAGQRRLFDAIARTPGIQLRLGHIAERQNSAERALLRALRETATDLGIEPTRLLQAFNQHWTFRPERQQKGVDTLIALDMVRLAQRQAYNAAILIAGDRDLAEAIRTAQDFGVRVLIATPNRRAVAPEVIQLADDIVDIGVDALQLMLRPRPERTN